MNIIRKFMKCDYAKGVLRSSQGDEMSFIYVENLPTELCSI